MTTRFRSLRFRLLLPLVVVSLLAAGAVAMGSYWEGDRWSRTEIEDRFTTIAKTLSGASYPLNQQVVDSLAGLTDTELLAVRENGTVTTASLDQTVREVSKAIMGLETSTPSVANASVNIAAKDYRYGVFLRGGPASSSDDVHRVVVLFDESKLREARFRAAALPLATGLSTVFLLTAVALFLSQRLIRRLRRLSTQVDRIAEGHFDSSVDVGVNDEIGVLGTGVRRMSGQLQQMWDSLQRTQGEKLLHQIAGGLAHQLRNSLTGARMAVELHHNKCRHQDDGAMDVALSQLEQTEDAVRRLLLVAAGKQDDDRPGTITTAIDDVQRTLAPTAKHLHVDLQWDIHDDLTGLRIADGPSLSAAISNLVLNAIQVARHVTVTAKPIGEDDAMVTIVDDGPGPPSDIQDDLFEPFVTSKPEGLGLGLPLVKRAAQRLGGQIQWKRENDQTVFELRIRVTSEQ